MILASNEVTLVKVDDGAKGDTGTSVSSMTTEFYLSTSKVTQTGGSWSTEMPTWSSGMYLWTRTKIVYSNPDSIEYTTPVCDSSWEASNESAKTATNYMNFDNNGLVVGNMMEEVLGKNVLIDSDSVDIRDGGTVLASFGANEVYLGKQSRDAVIDLCNGLGNISQTTDEKSGSNTLGIYSENNISLRSDKNIHVASFQEASTADGNSHCNAYFRTTADCVGNAEEDYACFDMSASRIEAGYNQEFGARIYGDDRYVNISVTDKNVVQSNTFFNPDKTTFSKPIHIQGIEFTGANKVLWTGASLMNASDTITLSEAISSQANGIVLVWGFYQNGEVQNGNFNSYFIPKFMVEQYNATGHIMFMTTATGNYASSKALYIKDTEINGISYNDRASVTTNASIKVSPQNFALCRVIGV